MTNFGILALLIVAGIVAVGAYWYVFPFNRVDLDRRHHFFGDKQSGYEPDADKD